MASVVVYAYADCTLTGTSTTYSTARSTCSVVESGAKKGRVGQDKVVSDYFCHEYCVSFDTSPPMTSKCGTLTETLDLTVNTGGDQDGTGFTAYVSQHAAWLGVMDSTNWVAGASLGALTVQHSLSTALVLRDEQMMTFTNDLITTRAATYADYQFLIHSSKHAAGTTPSASDYINFHHREALATDPRLTVTYVSGSFDSTAYFNGALGRTTIWPRVLSASEVQAHMAEGMVVYDRALDKGTAVIQNFVRTRTGTLVPATHVRAGWWIEHLETPNTKPLLITAHSVDVAAERNAITIGEDWMVDAVGVRMGELLAMPTPTKPEGHTGPHAEAAPEESLPGQTDDGDAASDSSTTYDPTSVPSVPYVKGSAPPAPGWSYDSNTNSWVLGSSINYKRVPPEEPAGGWQSGGGETNPRYT